MSLASDYATKDQGNSFYTAFARTTSRALALYFSRPVRLFRPTKGTVLDPFQSSRTSLTFFYFSLVSGWALLHGLASSSGTSLSPQFLNSFVKQHGVRNHSPRDLELN